MLEECWWHIASATHTHGKIEKQVTSNCLSFSSSSLANSSSVFILPLGCAFISNPSSRTIISYSSGCKMFTTNKDHVWVVFGSKAVCEGTNLSSLLHLSFHSVLGIFITHVFRLHLQYNLIIHGFGTCGFDSPPVPKHLEQALIQPSEHNQSSAGFPRPCDASKTSLLFLSPH